MTAVSAGSEPLSVPFVVGVTGHRDLDPADEVNTRALVRAELQALADRLQHTPLRLLSNLAEGADRLVVQEALAIDHPRVDVVAVLPMPLEVYARDFGPESRDEFDSLLESCHAQVVVPPDGGDDWSDRSIEAVVGQAHARELQYLAAGAWIVRHASLLVAVWDGQPAHGLGGTAQIVNAMRLGVSIDGTDVSLDPADVGPVIHVWARRAGENPINPRSSVRRLMPELLLGAGRDFSGRSSQQSRKVAFESVGVPLLDEANRSLSSVPTASGPASPPGAATPHDAVFQAFDLLADQERDTRSVLLHRVVLLGLSALLSLALYDFVLSRKTVRGSVLSMLLVPVTIVLARKAFHEHGRAKRENTDIRRADYRALAECLRVQRSWWTAGLPQRVADDYLLRQQPTETLWLRHALRSIDIDAATRPVPVGDVSAACREWMTEQHLFFARKSAQAQRAEERTKRKTKRLRNTCFVLLSLVALCHATIVAFSNERMFDVAYLDFGVIMDGLMLLAAGFAAAAAATSKLFDRSSMEHNAQYYEWGEARFQQARDRLESLINKGEEDHARALILQLGRLAVEENALWLIAQRARHIEAPQVV